MRIEQVEGRRGLQRFLDVPKRLHGPETSWVAPLDYERRRFFDPRKNAFLERGTIETFVAVDERGRDVARIAAIDNPEYNAFQAGKAARAGEAGQVSRLGFFGFFDAPDDPELARALIEVTAERARARGHERLHGPVNPSTNHECGLLVEGFEDPPTLMMPWNPPYYEPLLRGAALEGVKDLVAMRLDCRVGVNERFRHAEKVFRRRHRFELRPMDARKFERELEHFKSIYNDAWSENFGFVPLTDREMEELARDLRPILVPELCHIAEVDGEVVGVSLSLPDANQAMRPLRGRLYPFGWVRLLRGLRRIDRMRGLVLGVKSGYRKMGIDYALLRAGLDEALRRGYREIEIAWMLADNVAMIRPLERVGLFEVKRYRLYEKALA